MRYCGVLRLAKSALKTPPRVNRARRIGARPVRVHRPNAHEKSEILINKFGENRSKLTTVNLFDVSVREIIERIEYGLEDEEVDVQIMLEYLPTRISSEEFNPKEYTETELIQLLNLGGYRLEVIGKEGIAFAREVRINYVKKMWQAYKSKNIPITPDLLATKYLLDLRNHLEVDAMELLEKVNDLGLDPTTKVFETCTAIFADQGKFSEISMIIDHMKELDMAVPKSVLENFAYASALVGGLEVGEKTMARVVDAYSINKGIQNLALKIAKAAIKKGDIDGLPEFCKKYQLDYEESNLARHFESIICERFIYGEITMDEMFNYAYMGRDLGRNHPLTFMLQTVVHQNNDWRNKEIEFPILLSRYVESNEFQEIHKRRPRLDILDNYIEVKVEQYLMGLVGRKLKELVSLNFNVNEIFELAKKLKEDYGLKLPLTRILDTIFTHRRFNMFPTKSELAAALLTSYVHSHEFNENVLSQGQRKDLGLQFFDIQSEMYQNDKITTQELFKNLIGAKKGMQKEYPLTKFVNVEINRVMAERQGFTPKLKALILEWFNADEGKELGQRPHLQKLYNYLTQTVIKPEAVVKIQKETPAAPVTDQEIESFAQLYSYMHEPTPSVEDIEPKFQIPMLRHVQVPKVVRKPIHVELQEILQRADNLLDEYQKLAELMRKVDIREGYVSESHHKKKAIPSMKTYVIPKKTVMPVQQTAVVTKRVVRKISETPQDPIRFTKTPERVEKAIMPSTKTAVIEKVVRKVLPERPEKSIMASEKTAVILKVEKVRSTRPTRPAFEPSTQASQLRLKSLLGVQTVNMSLKKLTQEGKIDEAYALFEKTYKERQADSSTKSLPPAYDLIKAAIVHKNGEVLKSIRKLLKESLGGDNSFMIDMAVCFFELKKDDAAIKVLSQKDVYLTAGKLKFIARRELQFEDREDVVDKLITHASGDPVEKLQEAKQEAVESADLWQERMQARAAHG